MNLSPPLAAIISNFVGDSSKRALGSSSRAYYDEVKEDDTFQDYLKRAWASDRPPTKREEVYVKWLAGEPAFEEGFYRLVFAKGKRMDRGKRDKFPRGSHRHDLWRADPYVHSPDGRVLLFSHPSKGDVVLGATTKEGQKLVATYRKGPRMSRYTRKLIQASSRVQRMVPPYAVVSPWDPRLRTHGTPLPSLVGFASEPMLGFR
jgi:hypothetical protein